MIQVQPVPELQGQGLGAHPLAEVIADADNATDQAVALIVLKPNPALPCMSALELWNCRRICRLSRHAGGLPQSDQRNVTTGVVYPVDGLRQLEDSRPPPTRAHGNLAQSPACVFNCKAPARSRADGPHRFAQSGRFQVIVILGPRPAMLAGRSGRPMSSASAKRLIDGMPRTTAIDPMVVVAEQHRRKGVGRALVLVALGEDHRITWLLRAGRGKSQGSTKRIGFIRLHVAMERPAGRTPDAPAAAFDEMATPSSLDAVAR